MEIQIDPHTLKRAEERGTTEKEIKDVIETGLLIPAKYGRKGKFKIYSFKKNRQGKYYEQKRVEVFYITEGGRNNNRNCLCILWEMGGLDENFL